MLKYTITNKGLFITDYIEFSINNMGTISCKKKLSRINMQMFL